TNIVNIKIGAPLDTGGSGSFYGGRPRADERQIVRGCCPRGIPHNSRFMPELPEVETIARGLDRRVKGDVIESVWLGSKPEPLKSPAKVIAATLEAKKISGVRRIG